MSRKTIEYKGEFKVKLNFAMTSGEGVDDAIVEEVVKMMSDEMHEDIKDALEHYFGDEDDVVQHLEIKCEEIDHVINPLYSELTDEQICGNEWTEPKSFNVIVPECNDKNQNYYQKSAVTIDDFSQESKDKLKEAIIFAAENCAGERFPVYIHIGTGMYYDYAVENLFYSGEFFFFSCLDEINEEENISIDRYNVSIRRIGSMAGVNVYLSTE